MHEVRYCYPSSPMARRLRAPEGGYYVSDAAGKPITIAFRSEACALDWCRVTKTAVRPFTPVAR